MADFCKKCGEEMFGEDHGDLANLLPPEKYHDGYGASAICEGCEHSFGCVVDIDGTCLIRARLESQGIYPDRDGSKERSLEDK